VLTGSYAYKVKKPVNLGFVDFSSLQKRRYFCQEELRLNQRLAPDLYLELVEIHGPAEQANVVGSGTVIDVAVRMRQFDQRELLPQALDAGAVSGDQFELFAEKLATFQSRAAVAPPEGSFGTPEAVVAPALANLEVLSRLHKLGRDDRLHGWTIEEARRLDSFFARRLVQNRVREGHGDHALAGVEFQRALEVAAFRAGGGGYRAPAMTAADLVAGRAGGRLADTHFRPGLTPADLRESLPRFITDALAEGLVRFDRQIRGYASQDANLIAVESRTSSPVRIPRDDDTLEVPGFAGLHVAGEGPGYAGGIASAAADGLRAAHAILVAMAA
jgi:hypothetical protein